MNCMDTVDLLIPAMKKILKFKNMSPLSPEFILFFIELRRTFFDLHIRKFNYKVGANVNIDRVSPNLQMCKVDVW